MRKLALAIVVCALVVAVVHGDCQPPKTAQASSNLNCNWYNSNACCAQADIAALDHKAVEAYDGCNTITSRCADQFILYECGIFCSPDWTDWGDSDTGQIRICGKFADKLWNDCSFQEVKAWYTGDSCQRIRDVYKDGEALAAGLELIYVANNTDCYNAASSLVPTILILIASVVALLIL